MAAAEESHGATITASENTIRAARETLPAFKRATAPATREQQRDCFLMLSNALSPPEALRTGSITEQRAYWEVYSAVLQHVPHAVLHRAVMAFLALPPAPGKTDVFVPPPGTILAIARKDEDWRRMMDLRKGLERLQVAKKAGPKKDPNPIDEAILAQQMADFKKRMAALNGADRRAQDEKDAAARAVFTPPEPPGFQPIPRPIYRREFPE